jgi:hypothetical protein
LVVVVRVAAQAIVEIAKVTRSAECAALDPYCTENVREVMGFAPLIPAFSREAATVPNAYLCEMTSGNETSRTLVLRVRAIGSSRPLGRLTALGHANAKNPCDVPKKRLQLPQQPTRLDREWTETA